MPVLGDTLALIFPADDKSIDVLKKDEGDLPLIADLYKLCCLHCAVGKEHTVVAKYADGVSVDVSPTADQRWAEEFFEFQEFASIDNPGNQLAHIVGNLEFLADDTIDLSGVIEGRLRLVHRQARLFPCRHTFHDIADDFDGVRIALGVIV